MFTSRAEEKHVDDCHFEEPKNARIYPISRQVAQHARIAAPEMPYQEKCPSPHNAAASSSRRRSFVIYAPKYAAEEVIVQHARRATCRGPGDMFAGRGRGAATRRDTRVQAVSSSSVMSKATRARINNKTARRPTLEKQVPF